MKKVLLLTVFSTLLAAVAGAMPSKETTLPQTANERITRQVQHELLMLPRLSIFDNLVFKVDGDSVILMGQVRHAYLKNEAEGVVKHIAGVERVDNQIEILPVSPFDDRIRLQLARAIFRDPRLFEYSIESRPSIHIIVKNGHVNLEGLVRNQADKYEAGIVANEIPDVFSVQNDLQVENAPKTKK
jgi:hyperosmotically inducible periplasmic protein